MDKDKQQEDKKEEKQKQEPEDPEQKKKLEEEEKKKKEEEEKKKKEEEEKEYFINIQVCPIFEDAPEPFTLEKIGSKSKVKIIKKLIHHKFMKYPKKGYKLFYKRDLSDSSTIKDSKLKDGDYILWEYTKTDKEDKIPESVYCQIEAYHGDSLLFEDETYYSKRKLFGAILNNIDYFKPIYFFKLSSIKISGEEEKNLSLEDISKYKEQSLEEFTQSTVVELKEYILKDQDPDQQGFVPPPGQELKEKGIKFVLYYEPELQDIVRIRFISSYDSKINALSYDFRVSDTLAVVKQQYEELFKSALDSDEDCKIPSKFRFYSLSKAEEKIYFDEKELAQSIKDISSQLRMHKQYKTDSNPWMDESRLKKVQLPNKIQTFILNVEFDANVYLIYAPEFKGTKNEKVFFKLDIENKKVGQLKQEFRDFFGFNTDELMLIQYFETQEPEKLKVKGQKNKPWWWGGKLTLSGDPEEEKIQLYNRVVLLNDDCTLKQYDMQEKECKVLHIRKNMEKIIKRYPFEVQRELYKQKQDWEPSILKRINSIPWNEVTTLKRSDEQELLKIAHATLEKYNIGLDKQKYEILTFLAYQQQIEKSNPKSAKQIGQVLLFAGEAGTGKTSFALSIAEALHRKFAKICLAKDANLFGQNSSESWWLRKPGQIVDAIIEAGSMNPVILLDEIDKVPLEKQNQLIALLDPMQNNCFIDEVLKVPIDLSQVYFICTTNSLSALSAPLRNRLKIIIFEGYDVDEKIEIARKRLIPELEKQLNCKKLDFSDDILKFMLKHYVEGEGVRDFARKLEEIVHYQCFKLHSLFERNERQIHRKEGFTFTKELLLEAWPLFKTKYRDMSGYIRKPGCSNSLLPAQGVQRFEVVKVLNPFVQKEIREITGGIDNILYESINVCTSLIKQLYLRKQLNELLEGINTKDIQDFVNGHLTLHFHAFPHTRPKGGPFHGLAIAIAILSLLINKKVNYKYAFIGEVTLQGCVEFTSSLRCRLSSALKEGIERVYMPKINKPDIPKDIEPFLEFIFVDNIIDILDPMYGNSPFEENDDTSPTQFPKLVKTYTKTEADF